MTRYDYLAKIGISELAYYFRSTHQGIPDKITKDNPNVSFEFFYGGPFSQWYYAPFRVTVPYRHMNGKVSYKFSCTEQFMMWAKARVFDDDDAARSILSTNNPKNQKAIGRQVKNFDVSVWNDIAQDVILIGNIAKFNQNNDLHDVLMETDDRLLVEASLADKIYGIGMYADNPLINNPNNWKGTNWLGIALTTTKELLRYKDISKTHLSILRDSSTNHEI